MSVYGAQDILRKLQGALLQAGDAGEDSAGDAVFRTADAAVSSVPGDVAFDLQHAGEKAAKESGE